MGTEGVRPSVPCFLLYRDESPCAAKYVLRGRTLSSGQWLCADRNEEKTHFDYLLKRVSKTSGNLQKIRYNK